MDTRQITFRVIDACDISAWSTLIYAHDWKPVTINFLQLLYRSLPDSIGKV